MVVGVVVGDEDAVDVGDGRAEGGEAAGEGVVGGGVVPAGVDEDGAAVGVHDVDERVAEGVVGDRDLDAVDAAAVVGVAARVAVVRHGIPSRRVVRIAHHN